MRSKVEMSLLDYYLDDVVPTACCWSDRLTSFEDDTIVFTLSRRHSRLSRDHCADNSL